jgi:general secretion pathway protein D
MTIPPLRAALRASCRLAARGLAVLAWVTLASCAVPVAEQSHALWSEGRFEEAVLALQQASERSPSDRALRALYSRQRDLALSQFTIAADNALWAHRFEEAESLYQSALRMNPNSARARDGIERIGQARRTEQYFQEAGKWYEEGRLQAVEGRLRQILAGDPNHRGAHRLLQHLRERQQEMAGVPATLRSALERPVSVEFRETPLRTVFEVLSGAGGLNFVFDHDVHTDTRITIFIRNNSVDDVLRVLLGTNALERKVLNDNTLLIYPNTAAKAKEYQDLVLRTFYLVNADATKVQGLLKSLAKIKESYVDDKLNMVAVRDTPEAVRLAERLVESVDIAEAEVMLELEVVELSRTRAINLGIQLPGNIQRESSSPVDVPAATAGVVAAAGRIATSNMRSLITTVPNPLVIANLFASDADSNLLANPRIRVKNREKAKVMIGEKLPVITSTAVQNAGVASSVSYLDVGLKLEVEPQIYLDDEVGVKVNLEVNSNLGQVTVGNSTTGQTTAYQVGTRSAQTTLRLHDGETQVLAGLINDNESATWSKVPGLGDIPGVGRLFSNQIGNHEKTEIVLLVTPRIIRNLSTPEGERLLFPAGTEANIGAHSLSIGKTAPRSMSLRPGDTNPRLPQTAAPPTVENEAGAAEAAPAARPPGSGE